MAYGQWIDGSFLKNAPAAWGVATNESYTRAFPNHTTLAYTPELGYYLAKAKLDPFAVTIADAYYFLQTNKLFN